MSKTLKITYLMVRTQFNLVCIRHNWLNDKMPIAVLLSKKTSGFSNKDVLNTLIFKICLFNKFNVFGLKN